MPLKNAKRTRKLFKLLPVLAHRPCLFQRKQGSEWIFQYRRLEPSHHRILESVLATLGHHHLPVAVPRQSRTFHGDLGRVKPLFLRHTTDLEVPDCSINPPIGFVAIKEQQLDPPPLLAALAPAIHRCVIVAGGTAAVTVAARL